MITATGNNFGAGAITFKAYSTAEILVLNGKVEVAASDPAFRAATELEIYLPNQPMKKSAETAVYMVMIKKGAGPFATIVQAKLKNYNTISIEKCPLYQTYGDFTLVFACAFVPKGKVGLIEQSPYCNVSASSFDYTVTTIWHYIRVTEHWVALFLSFSELYGEDRTAPLSFYASGVPSDVCAEIPIIVHGSQDYDGSVIMMAEVNGASFNIPEPSYDAGDPKAHKFLKAVFVREEND